MKLIYSSWINLFCLRWIILGHEPALNELDSERALSNASASDNNKLELLVTHFAASRVKNKIK